MRYMKELAKAFEHGAKKWDHPSSASYAQVWGDTSLLGLCCILMCGILVYHCIVIACSSAARNDPSFSGVLEGAGMAMNQDCKEFQFKCSEINYMGWSSKWALPPNSMIS